MNGDLSLGEGDVAGVGELLGVDARALEGVLHAAARYELYSYYYYYYYYSWG